MLLEYNLFKMAFLTLPELLTTLGSGYISLGRGLLNVTKWGFSVAVLLKLFKGFWYLNFGIIVYV